MAKTPVDPQAAHAEAVADAKRLMRLSRTAALATLDPATGAPLTTLVGVASDFDGAPLFLMSTLARHTRHLASDPRASVLLTEEPERGDPLNHPRITLNGRIERAADLRVRARYLQPQPQGEALRRLCGFRFFPVGVESVHFNGGFGRADALSPADLLGLREGEAAFIEAEARLLDWVNGLGDVALARLAGPSFPAGRSGGRSASTRKVSILRPGAASPGSASTGRRATKRTGGRGWRTFRATGGASPE